MKSVSYNQRNRGHRKVLCPEAPQGPAQHQSSRSVMSYSLQPHEPTPGVHPNPCPLSQWCHPTISSSVVPFSLPSIFPSIRVFSNESALRIRWPKYWSYSFNISPSNAHPGLIFFIMDWLDRLAVQGTLQSILQHHSSKASILQCSAFFKVHFSHPYMTTGKTTALTRQSFVEKVMSLLFNMLSMLVITFLPRSEHLLISWLQSPSAVILELRKIKSATVSTVFPSICHEVLGPDVMIFVFWMLSFRPTFHSPLSPSSRSPLVLLHFLLSITTIQLFESMNVALLDTYLSGILQYLSFCDWLISLSIMSSRFILIFSYCRISVFLKTEEKKKKDWRVFHCLHIPYFPYLLICQWTCRLFLHLGCCE